MYGGFLGTVLYRTVKLNYIFLSVRTYMIYGAVPYDMFHIPVVRSLSTYGKSRY